MLPIASKRFLCMAASRPLRGVPIPAAALTMNEGERAAVEGPDGPIVVAKVGGKMFAVDAICPHMKKSMVDGPIESGPDGPELKCPFHNSKFCMATGKCTKWVTGIAGADTEMVAGRVRHLGGKKQDVSAYKIVTGANGQIELEKKEARRRPEADAPLRGCMEATEHACHEGQAGGVSAGDLVLL
eukprot:CAMPEP_0197890446 /NCGR_PEP_ID=MMETSP1439-20131203/26669_1 /TAXON_ID=66791 /ORGANISM="Gonyaulax spinifera, Strain CCMP409" /LENGTH=184 /DNA_ID=CAMNT_0043510481 /DNA_START=74 /DNA_END=625 /DNA_ORIENTATION=-